MPLFQAIAEKANAALNRTSIQNFPKAQLSLNQPFTDAGFQALGLSPEEIAYVRSWPESVRLAIRVAVHSAVNRTPPLPVTIAWSPGYDFEVTISEAPGTATSVGGITVLVRSPYPAGAATSS